MKNNFLLCVHTFFYFILFFPSFSFLHLSLLTASPSLLSSSKDPQTLLSSSETHCQSVRAQPPQTRNHQPTFGRQPDPFQPLFSIFGVLVLCFGLYLCFGLCLCFKLACVSDLCFGLGFCFGHGFRFLFRDGFVFRTVIFLLSFFYLLHWF